MFKDFFESLKIELTGVASTVEIGVPHNSKEGQNAEEKTDVIIYVTFVNIERLDRQSGTATIRVLLTAFLDEKNLENEDKQLEALEALDEIIQYLAENKRNYSLIPTPENMTNNIWSAFRIPLRPFLVYECPVRLTN